jgi:catechol 2,3-dioxygenase-like lactoylglutathione lyase family enzyme
MSPAVRQLRLVVATSDAEAAVAFFSGVLGMPVEEAYDGPDGARVTILGAGRATLEIANPAQQRYIDEVEVGRQVAGTWRVALEVDDARDANDAALAAGATGVAPPTRTPWDSLNARLDAPGGIHLTLFQELGDELA